MSNDIEVSGLRGMRSVRAAIEAGDIATIRAWVNHEGVCHSEMSRAAMRCLLAEVDRMREAVSGALEAWTTSHYMHFDRQGNAGATCPACALDSAMRRTLRAALAKEPTDAR